MESLACLPLVIDFSPRKWEWVYYLADLQQIPVWGTLLGINLNFLPHLFTHPTAQMVSNHVILHWVKVKAKVSGKALADWLCVYQTPAAS